MTRPQREILCGRQPALEALRAGRRRIFSCSMSRSVRPSPETDAIRAAAAALGVPFQQVAEQDIQRIAGDAHHQGVAIEAGEYPYAPWEDLVAVAGSRDALFLILDHIQDPQNLGAILRTAECAGVSGVVLPKDRAAAVTPAVVRASAGASEHVRVAMVTNIVRAMEELKEQGVWTTGFEAIPGAGIYSDADYTGPTGLVLGGEGHGLGRLVRERCDALVRIPLRGRVSSLNAGVAAAVALFEVQRQRGVKKG